MLFLVKIKNLILTLATLSLCFNLLFGFVAEVKTEAQVRVPSKDVICGGPCPFIDTTFDFSQEGLITFIISIARLLTYISIAVAVLAIVCAGFLFLIDGGSGTRADAGKKIIFNTIIGLIIVMLAYTGVYFLTSILQGDISSFFSSTPRRR